MKSVKVSPKFQVVIPKDVRRSMRLRPGMRFEVREYEGGFELVPIGRKLKFPEFLNRIEGRDARTKRKRRTDSPEGA